MITDFTRTSMAATAVVAHWWMSFVPMDHIAHFFTRLSYTTSHNLVSSSCGITK